jgi:integrase
VKITQRGNSFQVAVHYKGKRIRRQFQNKMDAETWGYHTKAALAEGKPVEEIASAGNRTWGDLLESTYRRYWKGAKSEKTLYLNGELVTKYFGLTNPLEDVMPEQIDSFIISLEDKGNSNATINRKLAALSKMLKFGYDRGWLRGMPKIERKKEPKGRIRWFTYAEEEEIVAKFRDLTRNDMADLILVLVDSGMRVGEALALQWRDCDNDSLTVWKSKNDTPRSVPMTSRIKEILERRRELGLETPFVNVKQTSFNHVWNYVKGLLGHSTDSQYVPHALRHTCASRLVQAGVPLLTVKEILGHKSIQVTMRYAHLAPKNLTDAIVKLEEKRLEERTA